MSGHPLAVEGQVNAVVAGQGSGPDPLGQDGHLLLVYTSETVRWRLVAQWVSWGLEHNEKVIYAELHEGSARLPLSRALAESGVEIGPPVEHGRLVLMAPAEFHAPGGQGDLVQRALDEGYRGVRMSAEVSTRRGALPEQTYQAYERDVEKLCRTQPVTSLCQYDRARTMPGRLAEAAATHFRGIRDTHLHTVGTERGMALTGEVDMSNAALLESALVMAATTAAECLELDVAELTFLDAAGYRALLRVADELRLRRARLILVAVQPQVVRTMSLLGVDELPHVEVLSGPEPAR